ncbi:SRPBCC family protein [Methyloceanibacter sp.]|uniref:SRPBCC family protein n=1 Tax=Methyloceanibacter sp. TaxID=1965321 RepID=UPI002D248061|nr:SRPBCC family protein [Methyloceanibacter sp.]HZP10412.1 SRPBCC family protein [Methyloceanibacter sp.]
MRPMMRLVVGLAALGGIMAAVAVGLPAHVTVTRAVITNAPESSVFPYLANLHHFQEWSPWAARDPQLKLTYSGPESGKGARVNWESQVRSIGTGSMEIVNADPNKTIELAVNFNGLEGTSLFDIAPSGSGSKVTWSFGYDSGSSPLKRWKALALDGFVGAEYRTGLDKLKAKLDEERRPVTPPSLMPGGASTQSEQPSAALPPGAATPPGTPATTGTATPATTGSATGATVGTSAPTAGSPQASATGTVSQPANAESTEDATPAPAAAPPKKKKRKNR